LWFYDFEFWSVHSVEFNRMTESMRAALRGDLQQLRVAVTVDNVNDNSDRVFQAAAWGGNIDCVKFCLEMGANVNSRAKNGKSPLYYATLRGHVEVVRILLDAGATVEERSLHCAICYNYKDIARLLIGRGAQVTKELLDDEGLPAAVPDWFTTIVSSRLACRSAATIIVGIHKYRRTNVTGNNDINVLRLTSKHIWSTRMDDGWGTPTTNK
jgi:hypothetical protein